VPAPFRSLPGQVARWSPHACLHHRIRTRAIITAADALLRLWQKRRKELRWSMIGEPEAKVAQQHDAALASRADVVAASLCSQIVRSASASVCPWLLPACVTVCFVVWVSDLRVEVADDAARLGCQLRDVSCILVRQFIVHALGRTDRNAIGVDCAQQSNKQNSE